MATDLQALPDADFQALCARRQRLVNTYSIGGIALAIGALFSDPEGMRSVLRAALAAMLLVSPLIYLCWLRPMNIEQRRRSGGR